MPTAASRRAVAREDDEHQHGEASSGQRFRHDLLHRSDGVDRLILGGAGDLSADGGDQAQGLGFGCAATSVSPVTPELMNLSGTCRKGK